VLDFPAAPTSGQSFTQGRLSWTFDGTKWTSPLLAGGTLRLEVSPKAEAAAGATPVVPPIQE
jgi:acyl dehydratase